MYKVLIVDDFPVDRENLRVILTSISDIEIEVIGESENGMEALEFISQQEPDIIISDIEMPFIDGFELAKNIRRDFPKIKIIFYSLYNDFEYARKALYLDTYGYILKPVNPNELRECIMKVAGLINDESQFIKEYEDLRSVLHQSKPVLVENLIRDMIYGLNKSCEDVWDKINFLNINLKKGLYLLIYIEIDDFEKVTYEKKMEQKQIFSLKIYEKLRDIICTFSSSFICRIDDSHFVIICNSQEESMADDAKKIAADIGYKILSEFKKTDVSLSLTISDCCKNIFELNELFEQCKYLMKYKYSLGKGKAIFKNDIPSVVISPAIDFNSIQKEIRFLLNSGNKDEIDRYIEDMFDNFPENSGEQYLKNLCFYIIFCAQVVLSENNENFEVVFNDEKLIWEKLLRFETILDAKNWIKNIIGFINQYLAKKSVSKNKAVTEEVKRYIESNFNKNLSLEVLAADLFYSPNYLNYIFKQETGETIFDYVCKCKIEKAKEMLANPRIKLYEITEHLGYSHSAYFSNVFKKYMGLTPKEYRDRLV